MPQWMQLLNDIMLSPCLILLDYKLAYLDIFLGDAIIMKYKFPTIQLGISNQLYWLFDLSIVLWLIQPGITRDILIFSLQKCSRNVWHDPDIATLSVERNGLKYSVTYLFHLMGGSIKMLDFSWISNLKYLRFHLHLWCLFIDKEFKILFQSSRKKREGIKYINCFFMQGKLCSPAEEMYKKRNIIQVFPSVEIHWKRYLF